MSTQSTDNIHILYAYEYWYNLDMISFLIKLVPKISCGGENKVNIAYENCCKNGENVNKCTQFQ